MPIDKSDYINMTEKQIDTFSIVTETDIEEAKILWRRSVSNEFKSLLDADTREDLITNA
jgi:hypothetical protein